ncbi:MAG TPA: hypothetical protein VH681_12465, partial [Nitrospiraceae bacterium]
MSNTWAVVCMRDEWGIVKGIVITIVMLAPLPVSAQLVQGIPRSPIGPTTTFGVPEDFYIMPWIAAGVVYDDNLFFQPRNLRQDDAFVRITPGLQASYQSTPFTIIGNYRFDSEIYNKFTELNSAQQRQFGTIEMRGRPFSALSWSGELGYAQTHTPFELNSLTNAQAARFLSERYFINPSAEYRLDSLTRLFGQYAFSRDIFNSEVNSNSHIITLGADRRVGAHDRLGPTLISRYFRFSGNFTTSGFVGGDPGPVNSHALALSWIHDFASDIRLEARAGPRLTNGDLDKYPEAFVGLRQRFQGGEVSLNYTSALTTVIGSVGATQSNSIFLTASYEPMRHLTFTVAPTVAWITNSAFDFTVYTAYAEAAYQINKYFTA